MAKTYQYSDQIFTWDAVAKESIFVLDGVFKTSFMFGSTDGVYNTDANGNPRKITVDTTKKNQWEQVAETLPGEYQLDSAGIPFSVYHNENGYVSKLRLKGEPNNNQFIVFGYKNIRISGTTETDAPAKKPLKINGKPVKGITLGGKKVKKIAINGKEYEF